MSKHITGHTGLLCLLGSPVAHSVSPEMHNEACDQLGLDYTYLAFDVPEDKMPEAVQGLRTMGARGWNITMPGKNIMCKLADKVSPASEISGACNTIVNDNGVLTAYTTDGVGFMRAVAENGVDIIGKKMTLLGAGGAATAILVQAALDGVAEINVFNVRDNFFSRAEEIVAKLNERTECKVTLHDFDDPEILRASIADSEILVNGTSVGMAPNVDRTIITDTSMFHKDLFVFDVIYNPQETRLLREAKEAGCKTGNGMYMLLYQELLPLNSGPEKKCRLRSSRRNIFHKNYKNSRISAPYERRILLFLCLFISPEMSHQSLHQTQSLPGRSCIRDFPGGSTGSAGHRQAVLR